jgi:inhibitor of KinA sporulation pathway (predicted exonuclease)
LTTLTQEQIAMGLSFVEACAQLRERYRAHERVWAGFGDFDHLLFERQCRRQGLPYPFGSRHLNIKTLLALFLGLPAELDLATALQRLGLPLEGTHHRGDDDAWNIAAILAHLFARYRSASLLPSA